jgi:DNA-binding NtrC family response regulator
MPAKVAKIPITDRADAFVIDDENAMCEIVTAALGKLGLTVASFDNAAAALAALDRQAPKIIFLDIALKQSDAIDVIKGLSESDFAGIVQLFSSHKKLLAPIQRIAMRYRLAVSPPLAKPLKPEAIRRVVAEAGIAGAAVGAP